jgi:hypothetical protein
VFIHLTKEKPKNLENVGQIAQDRRKVRDEIEVSEE